MDRNQDQRSAIGGGDQSRNAQYDQPKGRLFEQAQNFRNVVIVGEDADGKRHILSDLPEAKATDWLKQSQFEPTT
jgi:hypothetical protein